jgi:hypothetical protein
VCIPNVCRPHKNRFIVLHTDYQTTIKTASTMVLTFLQLIENGSPDDTSNKRRLFRDTLVELIATAVFVFNGTLSAVSTGRKLAGQGSAEDVARIMPIAFSFGVSIMTLAYAIGHLSGGHMNPAVSLLMFFRRQMSIGKMLCIGWPSLLEPFLVLRSCGVV